MDAIERFKADSSLLENAVWSLAMIARPLEISERRLVYFSSKYVSRYTSRKFSMIDHLIQADVVSVSMIQ